MIDNGFLRVWIKLDQRNSSPQFTCCWKIFLLKDFNLTLTCCLIKPFQSNSLTTKLMTNVTVTKRDGPDISAIIENAKKWSTPYLQSPHSSSRLLSSFQCSWSNSRRILYIFHPNILFYRLLLLAVWFVSDLETQLRHSQYPFYKSRILCVPDVLNKSEFLIVNSFACTFLLIDRALRVKVYSDWKYWTKRQFWLMPHTFLKIRPNHFTYIFLGLKKYTARQNRDSVVFKLLQSDNFKLETI